MSDQTIPAPAGRVWLCATPGRSKMHLTTNEPHDMTSLCGRWFRHGWTKGERAATELPCGKCLRVQWSSSRA